MHTYYPAPLVPRPCLLDRLNRVASSRVCLVSAPAGLGKPTLLSDWVRTTELSIAWLALDESDNEPLMFWTYVSAALQRQHVDLGAELPALLQASPSVPAHVLLLLLLKQLLRDPVIRRRSCYDEPAASSSAKD